MPEYPSPQPFPASRRDDRCVAPVASRTLSQRIFGTSPGGWKRPLRAAGRARVRNCSSIRRMSTRGAGAGHSENGKRVAAQEIAALPIDEVRHIARTTLDDTERLAAAQQLVELSDFVEGGRALDALLRHPSPHRNAAVKLASRCAEGLRAKGMNPSADGLLRRAGLNGRASLAPGPDTTRPRSGIRWGAVFAAVLAGLSMGAVRLYWSISRSIEREPAPVQVAERPPPPVASIIGGVETMENGRKIVTLPSGIKLEQQDDGSFEVQKRVPRAQADASRASRVTLPGGGSSDPDSLWERQPSR